MIAIEDNEIVIRLKFKTKKPVDKMSLEEYREYSSKVFGWAALLGVPAMMAAFGFLSWLIG